MNKYAWWALALSIILHLATVLTEPILNWLQYRQIDDPALKQTQRKLQAQSLTEDDAAAELNGVKPVEQQYVLLRSAPLSAPPVRAKPVTTKAAPKKQMAIASAITASNAASVAVASEAASKVATSSSASAPAASLASATEPRVKVASAASSASRASAVAIATKIDHGAAKRFPREVKIEYRYMGFPAYLRWQLAQGRYDLQLDVPIPGHARRFISRGKVEKYGVMPEQFIEYRKQFDTPKYDVHFDWDNQQVTLSEGVTQKTEPFAAGDQDLMSAALHLALMGGSQPKYEMALFSGRKRYPGVQFELKGEAQLKIGDKEITALLMSSRAGDRQVDFWLAPDWNNLPVRMVINFGKDGSYDLSAYNVSLDGKKVLEWVSPNAQAQQVRRP